MERMDQSYRVLSFIQPLVASELVSRMVILLIHGEDSIVKSPLDSVSRRVVSAERDLSFPDSLRSFARGPRWGDRSRRSGDRSPRLRRNCWIRSGGECLPSPSLNAIVPSALDRSDLAIPLTLQL